ncbi:hypothetical protein AUP07_0774 [methanogenic archaeon mixed culture ISO4-G1]|nr:hypothetical protein AUP07_0774 [methanogenic archaeon mixed culture ISO4-G1]
MREYLTPDDICNQISMNRSLFKGTILVTEGSTDQRLYSKFVEPKGAKILPAYSKSNVINVLRKMESRRDGKVLGIVDRDLDDLNGKTVVPPLFYTDNRDMEMMLIVSNALDDVLMEYADRDRMERFCRGSNHVRDVILDAAYPLGLLMYVSHVRGYNLNFKGLNFHDFIDRRTLSTDVQKMVQAVIENTLGCELSKRAVVKDLQSHMASHPDHRALSRGHDAVSILLIGLKEVFGSYNSSALNEGSLGGALRLAFSFDDFRETELYSGTKKWAESRGIRLWKVSQPGNPRS